MSTKCIVLGKNEQLKGIEFLKYIYSDEKINDEYGCKPQDWKNIELICRDYNETDYDLMFAYDDNRSRGSLFFGKWNDGVV